MCQNNVYLTNYFASAGKTLVPGIGQKGLFLQIVTFQIFFSASIVHCIDHCKVNLPKMVSWLSNLVFFLSYRYKKSTL